MDTSNAIIQTDAECVAKDARHHWREPATHMTSWGSTFCDDCYERLKDLIARNESPEYDRHICAKHGCGQRSYNSIRNVAYPGNEEWLCEKHYRSARMTTMIQEKTGGWSLCNICHQALDLLDGFAQDAAGNFVAPIEEPATCYSVTPAVVQCDQIPPCFIGGGFGTGENWHTLTRKEFLICAKCWSKMGVVPSTIGCSHRDEKAVLCGKTAIQHIEKQGVSSWCCEEHWQDQSEVAL